MTTGSKASPTRTLSPSGTDPDVAGIEAAAARTAGGYPAPPWRLRGQAILRLQGLDADLAPMPAGLSPLCIFSGRTLGGLYIASYGEGSSLYYNELIVFSALARSGARIGAWISDIYVDSERSAAGGREIWGLPKQLAHFRNHCEAGVRAVSVSDDKGSVLCEILVQPTGRRIKLPVLAPAWSAKGGSMLWFFAKGTAAVSRTRGEIRVPPTSALAGRGIKSGRMLLLDKMDVLIGSGTMM
jgi:acetoacetate decarboxylase